MNLEMNQQHIMLSIFITITVLVTNTYSYGLKDVLLGNGGYSNKRNRNADGGNPCPTPEKPFPCKNTPQCIPMSYVCDKNFDCDDGYDENEEVCTAANRPSIDDIMSFLENGKDWLIPVLFKGKQIGYVAHGLAVSKNLSEFKHRLNLSKEAADNFQQALKYIKDGNEEAMIEMGMPPNAWHEVYYFFEKLNQGGFLN